MIDKRVLKELEDMINGTVDPVLFPYQKGNSIRIGSYIIRCNKKGYYKVYDCSNNTLVTETFCKTSAVALAKSLSQGKHETKTIKQIDKDIQKWYNDCVFYRHTMQVTKDDFKREITATRYDIARHKTSAAKHQLDKYIYA